MGDAKAEEGVRCLEGTPSRLSARLQASACGGTPNRAGHVLGGGMPGSAGIRQMRFFSVFTGIGGFDLGLERAAWECVGQCEIEPFPIAVLEKHWPNVWRHGNVKTLTGELIRANCGRIDALIGGPPCQPTSVAGQRRGAADDRWLWPEFLRLVSEVHPVWVLAENPRGVFSLDVDGLQFSEWLAREFAAGGYEVLPVELAAEDVGAPHRRERVWFVAYRDSEHGRTKRNSADESHTERQARHESERRGDGLAITASNGRREGRPEPAREQGRFDATVGSSDMADSDGHRQQQPQGRIGEEWRRVGDSGAPRRESAKTDSLRERLQAVESGSPDDGGYLWPARQGEFQYEWEEPRVVSAEFPLGASVDGIPARLAGRYRVAALKACGNAVVPACAEALGRMINRFMQSQFMQSQ